MINMIVRSCYCCDQPYDQCKFQTRLRKFGLDKFAETLVREVETQCTTTSSEL